MFLFPAIDIKGRRVVRLLRGDYDQVTVYESTPVEAGLGFAEAGARHLHVVDLDGAKDGETSNFETIREVLSATGMEVEVGGGIRDLARIERYLAAGASRGILGTAALENPAFLREALAAFGEAVSVGVDAVNGRVATHGWLHISETDSFDFCREMRDIGVKTVIYTDVSRDGTLSGTNMDAYRQLAKIEGLNIVASGGITYLDELRELSEMGTYAAILGKALYSGKLDLREALAVTGGAN